MASVSTISLDGSLDFDSVNDKKDAFFNEITMASNDTIHVLMEKVLRADSAGLSLMIEGVRLAKQLNKTLSYKDMPKQLISLAVFCRVDDLLRAKDDVRKQ